MEPNAQNGWKIATGVLALVVVILLAMMWSAWSMEQKSLDHVLEEGKEDVVEARAAIEMKCRGPQANEAQCQDALEDLADILKEFSKDVNAASTSGSAQ